MMIKAVFKKESVDEIMEVYLRGSPELVSKEYNNLKERLIKQGYEVE